MKKDLIWFFTASRFRGVLLLSGLLLAPIASVDSRGVDTPDGSPFYQRICKARPDGSGLVVLAGTVKK